MSDKDKPTSEGESKLNTLVNNVSEYFTIIIL